MSAKNIEEKSQIAYVDDRSVSRNMGAISVDKELRTPLTAWIVVAAAALYYSCTLVFLTAAGLWRENIIAEIGGSAISLVSVHRPTNSGTLTLTQWLVNALLVVG